MVQELWVEKYRPKTVDEYVFRDQRLKNQVETWIQEKTIPHLLLYGPAGTGKSSLARILINNVGIEEGDLLYINASDQTGIDTVREKIQNFVSTFPLGDYKVVLLEEADHVSINGQAALRRILEDYAQGTRFILTCNYVNKVIPAIRSRCQDLEIKTLNRDDFKIKIAEILVSEEINFESEDNLEVYVKAYYPDLRKCINTMQLNCQNGKLLLPSDNDDSTADWQVVAVDLFEQGKIAEARKLICSQIQPEQVDDFFRLCYRNLDWWGDSPEHQEMAIIIIRDAIVKQVAVGDPEINLSAMLVDLARIRKES